VNQDDVEGPDSRLTEEEALIMAAMRTVLESADPVPPGLVGRVQFGLDLEPVDTEVSRLVAMPELVGTRSDEFTRLVTFQSDSLTIMITVEECVDGTKRIDGWLTPAACRHVELRCTSGPLSTESDDTGRFSVGAVPTGSVRLFVHAVEGTGRVVTPTIEI
jgi:hypothetical protein